MKVKPNGTSASPPEPRTAARAAGKGDVPPRVLVCRVPGSHRGSSCRRGQVQSAPIPSNSSNKKTHLWKTEFPRTKINSSRRLSRCGGPQRAAGPAPRAGGHPLLCRSPTLSHQREVWVSLQHIPAGEGAACPAGFPLKKTQLNRKPHPTQTLHHSVASHLQK